MYISIYIYIYIYLCIYMIACVWLVDEYYFELSEDFDSQSGNFLLTKSIVRSDRDFLCPG